MIKPFIILIAFSLTQVSSVFSVELCDQLIAASNRKDLDSVVGKILDEQLKKYKKTYSRHEFGAALNECNPSNNSEGLVISFAGTGSYNPRSYHAMRTLIQCNVQNKLSNSLLKQAYTSTLKMLKQKKSSYTKWSGIEKGPLSKILTEDALLEKMNNFNFASFGSEESELISDISSFSYDKLKEVMEEVKKSSSGYPIGISKALICAKKYFTKAKELKIDPKLIILTHSSGGRSAVKFLEKFKKFMSKEADLVFTMDPVVEAHEAIFKVLPQLAARYAEDAADYLDPFHDNPSRKVKIWSQTQAKRLYKTSNTKRWISLYQNKDEKGLGTSPRFGICGSPIHNADQNYYLSRGLGYGAHGEIVFNERLLSIFSDEILKL